MDKGTGWPVFLYLYWSILIVLIILLLSNFLYRRIHYVEFFQDKPAWKFFFYMILILLGFLLYFIEQMPVLSGYFDFTDMKFIHGYEEGAIVGFIRFIYKAAVGILLLIYGLTGMHGNSPEKTSLNLKN